MQEWDQVFIFNTGRSAARVVEQHLKDLEETEEMTQMEIFTNENIDLKTYGAIYKDGDKYTIANQKVQKEIIAEAFFQKTLFEKG